MIPSDGSGGVVYGRIPAVNILSSIRFYALVGCSSIKPDGDMIFQVNYNANGGDSTNLGS